MKKYAEISDCEKYRYALWRIWDKNKPVVMFVGLNPSKADNVIDDSTVRRCINFAQSWGYGSLCVANLFALRSTKPSAIYSEKNPIGPKNNYWLSRLAKESEVVVAAWGNHGRYLERSKEVLKILSSSVIYCLAVNKSGEPAHPLYQPATAKPVVFLKR